MLFQAGASPPHLSEGGEVHSGHPGSGLEGLQIPPSIPSCTSPADKCSKVTWSEEASGRPNEPLPRPSSGEPGVALRGFLFQVSSRKGCIFSSFLGLPGLRWSCRGRNANEEVAVGQGRSLSVGSAERHFLCY